MHLQSTFHIPQYLQPKILSIHIVISPEGTTETFAKISPVPSIAGSSGIKTNKRKQHAHAQVLTSQ